ncbi:hypothetical protein CB0940_08805 [Cercospora beticola]|uniref:Uncharacterized protein n=1 Tax=Cercospora beticola TaxID=122368 RepID=A0A2G5HQ63_CERBT|nr:hypothetical protein CB0940_08805 [Cercospora beticola]PIA94670.1 hypothetical protein CB0940_08805 [Cercospora beticola]WPB05392.1 hypothetical protein RHO25_010044 [Cercospora beticola]
MPSLFGSRRRGSSASRQPVDTNTSYAASVAARAAASGSRPSSSHGLSSAAAAAALRSHTSSPEPIGSIQTKRMVRRGSQSSIGTSSILSGRGGTERGGLQRRGSQSSMTERTFRSPSPGRSNSITNGAASPLDAPPVPAIPQSVQQRSHQRSASVEPPYRVSSPTPNGKGARSNSMDRKAMSPPPSHRRGARLSNVNEELEGPEAQRGVNFSRPRSSQPNSPSSSPTTDKAYVHGTGAWFSEPVPVKNNQSGSTGAPSADVLSAKMARIQGAQGQSVKKDNHSASTQGAQLRVQTQPTITGTAVTPFVQPQQQMETVMVFDAASRTFVPKLQPRAAAAPPSPVLPQAPKAAPGTYDPHTRTIVPAPAPAPARTTPAVDLGPPPRNPARITPTSSPRDSYLGSSVSGDSPKGDRILQASLGATKPNAITNRPQRASSLDVPSRNTPSNRGRQVSASPSPQRKPHFSASPVSQATIHDPPPRDISPAKSALKNSPSSSVRAYSPVSHFAGQPKPPPSETSDATSVYSQDGLSSAKKKKSAHVSFDEQPKEIDAAAAASPKILARERSPVLDDLDDEDFSKPRPALPTFGSVRRQREVAEKVTEMAPDRNEHSNDHAIGGILRNANGSAKPEGEPMPPVVVSKETAANASDTDSDVGDRGDYAAANAATVSLPEQTAGQTAQIHDEPSEKSAVAPIVRDFASPGATGQHLQPAVPEINLMPPTPGAEEDKTLDNRHSAEIIVPGGWGADTEPEVKPNSVAEAVPSIAPVLVHTPEEHGPMLAPIDEDTDTDEAEFSDAAEEPSEIEGGFASLDAIAVSPINVKASPSAQTGTTSPPDSPIVQKVAKKEDGRGAAEDDTPGDWNSTTAYWSKLSRQQREQIERDHMSSDDEARPSPAVMKKTRKTTNPAPASSPQSAQKSSPAHRDARPVQPALKKTMRAQPEPESAPVEKSHSMRRSMRDGGLAAGSMRSRPASTSQAPEPRAGGFSKKTMRPQSSASLSASSAGAAMVSNRASQDAAQPQHIRPPSSASTTTAPAVSTRLQKELSHDSDSESSFKKKRRSNAAAAGGSINMKRSMRAAPTPVEQRPSSPDPVRSKGKGSLIRSLSPSGSIFGRKKANDVRESIRSGSVDGGSRMTIMRATQPAKTMRQTPAAPAPKQKASSSKFKSRFADSDDSDDEPITTRPAFRSRFKDSDDESDDELTPVRGIPRRKGQDDGDSTDLEDSEDESGRKPAPRARERQKTPLVPDPADVDKAMEAARKKLGMTNGFTSAPSTPQKHDEKQGSSLAQGSLRNSQPPQSRPQSPDGGTPRKKSFMGSFLRRNRGSQHSVMTVSGVPGYDSAAFAQSSSNSPPLPLKQLFERPQSPTSPGKLVRRSSAQTRQQIVRGDSNFSTATAPPTTNNSSWPLADAPPVPAIPADVAQLKGTGDTRPATSDGHPSVRFSEDAIAAKGDGVYSSRTGKKKKFGMLRRAFRLND